MDQSTVNLSHMGLPAADLHAVDRSAVDLARLGRTGGALIKSKRNRIGIESGSVAERQLLS